jgi:hypothetical protein
MRLHETTFALRQTLAKLHLARLPASGAPNVFQACRALIDAKKTQERNFATQETSINLRRSRDTAGFPIKDSDREPAPAADTQAKALVAAAIHAAAS